MVPAFIDEGQVLKLFNAEGLVEDVSKALINLHRGLGNVPDRVGIHVKGNWWGLMFGHVEGFGVAVKVVNMYPGNRARGLRTIQGIVVFFDEDTGTPLAMIDAPSLTGLRTAAASALSTIVVKAPTEVLGFIGAGEQARYHLMLFSKLFKISKIIVNSRSRGSALNLASQARSIGIDAEVADDPSVVVSKSSTVIAATTSTKPVITVKPREGSHVISVGAPKPVVEVERSVLEGASCILVDTRDGVLRESGEDFSGLRLVELAEVLTGEESCRFNGGYTVYKSVGFAALDLAAAYHIYTAFKATKQPSS